MVIAIGEMPVIETVGQCVQLLKNRQVTLRTTPHKHKANRLRIRWNNKTPGKHRGTSVCKTGYDLLRRGCMASVMCIMHLYIIYSIKWLLCMRRQSGTAPAGRRKPLVVVGSHMDTIRIWKPEATSICNNGRSYWAKREAMVVDS